MLLRGAGHYEGGFYKVHVTLPATYPYKSPSIGFCTPIFVSDPCHRPAPLSPLFPPASADLLVPFPLCPCAQHPNVDEASGSVCLDVINQTWSPMFDLVNVFAQFLPQLLLYPNPADPLNRLAAQLLLKDPKAYQQRVQDHVRTHASSDFKMSHGDDHRREDEDAGRTDDAEDDEEGDDGDADDEQRHDADDAMGDDADDACGDDEDEVLSDCDDLPTDDPADALEL